MMQESMYELLSRLKEQDIKITVKGDNLKINAKQLSDDIKNEIIKYKPQLLSFLANTQLQETRIPHDSAQQYQPFALNENQQAYWIGRSQNNVGGGVGIHLYFELNATELDVIRLESAWHKLVQRHPMLRAVVTQQGQQQVLEQVSVPPFALKNVTDDRYHQALSTTREQLSHKNYDLTSWPQFDFTVVESDTLKTLCISIECWSIDGWSYQILFEEWWQLYQGKTLAPLTITFKDYLRFIKDKTENSDLAKQLAAKLPAAPNIPMRASNLLEQPVFVRHEKRLSIQQTSDLKAWCSKHNVTLASTLLTLYAQTLRLWSNSNHFTLNIPHFNRQSDDKRVNDIIGEFATFSLIVFDFRQPQSLLEQIKAVQQQVLTLLDSNVSGVSILRERNAMLQDTELMPFVFTNAPEKINSDGNKQSFIDTLACFGEMTYAISQTPQVFIDCQYHESVAGLYLFWDVRTNEFYPEQTEQMFAMYLSAINGLIDSSTNANVSSHSINAETTVINADTEQLALPNSVLNKRKPHHLPITAYSIWQSFEATLQNHPHKTAVICGDELMSWQDIANEVYHLSACMERLISANNQRVMLLLEKGWQQMVGFLACLHQGHTVVPVDPSNPISRLSYIAEDAKVKLALYSADCATKASQLDIPSHVVERQKQPSDSQGGKKVNAETLLLIYTSGTTGKPKGVQINEEALTNAIAYTTQRFNISDDDVLFGLTQLYHDMAWFDMLAAIKTAATVVYPSSQNYRNPNAWSACIKQHHVTVWNSVPQLMQMLVESLSATQDVLSSVRLAFLGGDWIPLSLYGAMQQRLPSCRLISVGGPTETTLWNIMHEVDTVCNSWNSIPYGRPITNNEYVIVNNDGLECPDWVVGELCCAGVGVTKGYINQPELNEEKFFIHQSKRYYKTGDLGRYHPDGLIEFIGRKDNQVMVGGYRIEIQEITRTLELMEEVQQAQSILDEGVIKAFIVLKNEGVLSSKMINEFLSQHLPSQMMPSSYYQVDAIPLTQNGKVDRHKLLTLQQQIMTNDDDKNDTYTESEQKVQKAWEEILGTSPKNKQDDFFLLGGNSLAVVRLYTYFWPNGHESHSIVTLFEQRTLAQQALLI